MKQKISKIILNAADNYSAISQDHQLNQKIYECVDISINAFKNDKKILFCGNGGSASDAQHLAAELSGRFYFDRPPLYAEALHVNSSYITAVANDHGYKDTYSRMIESAGREGDVLFALSTSGNSNNVLKAIEKAKDIGMITIGLTGLDGGKLKTICDIVLSVPSNDTPRVQEGHILIGHIICQLIEEGLFSNV